MGKNRGTEWQAPKARGRGAAGDERGGFWGGVIPLPGRLGGLGERRELPQRGPGQSPGHKRVFGIFYSQEPPLVER